MRYTKKPVTIEAIRFIGLTDFGDPQFDASDGMPEWLMEALAAPEGEPGSIYCTGIGERKALALVSSTKGPQGQDGKWGSVVPSGDWIVRRDDGRMSIWGPDLFAATYDASDDHPGPAWKEGDSLAAPKDETPADFLARLGMDGMEWAKAFVQQFEGKSIGYDASSNGVDDVLGWFCNAIMAGYDRGRAQGWKEDAPHGHERVAPEIVQVAKEARRSLLLDMQSECIQLRVALAKARDQFAFYAAEHQAKADSPTVHYKDAEKSKAKAETNRQFAAMCQTAIDSRPATGSTEALTSALAETSVEHPSDLPNGSVDRLRTAAKPFVIGQGFSDTVGDSDGDDGA